MGTRVQVQPSLLAWAVDRSRLDSMAINAKFPHLSTWLARGSDPTFKQLEAFARYTHTPLGYFFLPEPPEEEVPIPDFRTSGNAAVERPSPDLLDTIFDCQMRQEWYQDYAQAEGLEPLNFVGSVETGAPVVTVATLIREALGLDTSTRRGFRTTDDFRKYLIQAIEVLGVLVMVSGVVGNNQHRKLDPQEFRGFAIADRLVPVIFVNGADAKAAQVFSLIHELAHIWAGDTGLSDSNTSIPTGQGVERWANQVAAEVLVPEEALKMTWNPGGSSEMLQAVAGRFKVSTLVVLKRAFDAGLLGWDDFRSQYQSESARIQQLLDQRGTGNGGNFHYTQALRVGRQFAKAVVSWTLEGRMLYSDAYRLLGTPKHETFERFAEVVMG